MDREATQARKAFLEETFGDILPVVIRSGTCYNFTTLLPRGNPAPGQVRLSDMWAVMDSQETVGVSPELFHEQVFPHYEKLAALFGLVYWGCCEPADPLWESSLSKLPNLKAISISRCAACPRGDRQGLRPRPEED